MPFITKTPRPPYYAVVFTSINADVDHSEHAEMYKRMVELAGTYEGYLGIEAARNSDGCGVAVVYWKDHESILAFARDPEHMIVKRKGRGIWYSHYMIRICKVERDYGRRWECWAPAPRSFDRSRSATRRAISADASSGIGNTELTLISPST